MGGCRCSYKNCRSATDKTLENQHFFHYPVRQPARCRKWIQNACKPSFLYLDVSQLVNKVVCELHFEEHCFVNVSHRRLFRDAIPTLDACKSYDERVAVARVECVSNADEMKLVPVNEDGTVFTVHTNKNLQEIEDIETYRYNSDGSLIRVYENQPNVVESVINALEDSNAVETEEVIEEVYLFES